MYSCIAKKKVRAHLNLISSICMFPDEALAELDSSSTGTERRSTLEQHRKACMLAIKTIDRPNVHRLLELAHSTISMVAHLSNIGELVFEKTHQMLKRALKQSNLKDSHLQAMTSIIVDDWRKRIASSACKAYSGDEKGILSCARLLCGNNAALFARDKLSAEENQTILNVLGPKHCMLHELGPNHYAMLRSSIAEDCVEKWELCLSNQPCIGTSFVPLSVLQTDLSAHLIRALRGCVTAAQISTSTTAKSTFPNGLPGQVISCGDIIELLCLYPTLTSAHYPFLLQISRAGGTLSGLAMWCVVGFACIQRERSCAEHFVAVLPCSTDTRGTSCVDFPPPYDAVKPNGIANISFARPDRSLRKIPRIDVMKNDGIVSFVVRHRNGYPPRSG